MASNQDEARVTVSGKSDAYDRVLGKIIEKNKELSAELMKSKEILESLNPVYEELARNAQRYADALRGIRPLTKIPSFDGRGFNETIGSGRGRGSGSGSPPLVGGNLLNRRTEANLFDMIEKRLRGLLNRMLNLLFSFDEVETIPISLPSFDSRGRGRGGGRGSGGVPTTTPSPVPSFSPVGSGFSVRNPFASWEPMFSNMVGRMQGQLNSLKFPNIFPSVVTIPVVFTGLEVAIQMFNGVITGVSQLITWVTDSVGRAVDQFRSLGNWVSRVYENIVGWFNNPWVRGTLEVLGFLAPLLIPGAGAAVTGARALLTAGRVSRAASGISRIGSAEVTMSRLGSLGTTTSRLGSRGATNIQVLNIGGNYSRIGSSLDDLGGPIRLDRFNTNFRVPPRGTDIAEEFRRLIGDVPKYATGGFHVRPHLGVVGDVREVTIPLNSPASKPAYAGIADNLLNAMGNGSFASSVFNIHVGEGANIIADQYSIKRFAQLITDQVQYNLRNTGGLTFNRK